MQRQRRYRRYGWADKIGLRQFEALHTILPDKGFAGHNYSPDVRYQPKEDAAPFPVMDVIALPEMLRT